MEKILLFLEQNKLLEWESGHKCTQVIHCSHSSTALHKSKPVEIYMLMVQFGIKISCRRKIGLQMQMHTGGRTVVSFKLAI